MADVRCEFESRNAPFSQVGPCVISMVGARTDDEQLLYPVSDLAGRHGASAEKETPDPQQAYAPFERPRPGKPSYWHQLPWA